MPIEWMKEYDLSIMLLGGRSNSNFGFTHSLVSQDFQKVMSKGDSFWDRLEACRNTGKELSTKVQTSCAVLPVHT